MTNTHYDVARNSMKGMDFYETMRTLGAAWDRFTRLRGTLIQQQDNAATGAAVFAPIAVTYGYTGASDPEKQAAAAASFAEIDSAFGAANAAVTQMLNRHL